MGLTQAYQILSPENRGIEPGSWAYSYYTSDDSEKTVPVVGSFWFERKEGYGSIYGWTVKLPSQGERDVFDGFLDYMDDMAPMQRCGNNSASFLEVDFIEPIKDMGTKTLGTTSKCSLAGEVSAIRLDAVGWRRVGIGAMVFMKYLENEDPPVEIGEAVHAYDDRIRNPVEYECSLTQAEASTEGGLNSVTFKADGFIPFEPRVFCVFGIYGEGENEEKVANCALGGGGESADANGMIEGEISWMAGIPGKELQAYELMITGGYSRCEINYEDTWH
jgi:hypothetical protein